MARKWGMVRLPAELIAELQGYALTLGDQLDPKQQGNHEDPRDWSPPLWAVIQLLLERDQEHRKRSHTNNRSKAAKIIFDSEVGSKTSTRTNEPSSEGSVYTEPMGSDASDLPG